MIGVTYLTLHKFKKSTDNLNRQMKNTKRTSAKQLNAKRMF